MLNVPFFLACCQLLSSFETSLQPLGDVVDHRLMQRLVVPLQRQHVVRFTPDDLFGDPLLGPHGVDRDDPASDVDLLEQLGDGGDLVGFRRAERLPQGQSLFAGPGGDHMERPKVMGRIMTPSSRLAIKSDDRPFQTRRRYGLVAEALDPGVEAGLESLGLEDHQEAAEDVLAGNAARQVQEAFQEFLLILGPAGDGGGSCGAGEYGQHGDDQNAGQGVSSIDMRTGIFQAGERFDNFVQFAASARHRRPPVTGSRSAVDGRYTRLMVRAQGIKICQIVIKVRASPSHNADRVWLLATFDTEG